MVAFTVIHRTQKQFLLTPPPPQVLRRWSFATMQCRVMPTGLVTPFLTHPTPNRSGHPFPHPHPPHPQQGWSSPPSPYTPHPPRAHCFPLVQVHAGEDVNSQEDQRLQSQDHSCPPHAHQVFSASLLPLYYCSIYRPPLYPSLSLLHRETLLMWSSRVL